MVTNILGTDVGVHDPRWLSRFGSYECVASHSTTEAAGSSSSVTPLMSILLREAWGWMDLGLQDGVNLGWKLGAVLRRGGSRATVRLVRELSGTLSAAAASRMDSPQLVLKSKPAYRFR